MSLVTFTRVGKSFGQFDVLKEVTFSLAPGAKAGLVGENGSGKSTILKLIARELRPDKGVVAAAKGSSVAYVPQLPDLSKRHTALVEVLAVRPLLRGLYERLDLLERASCDQDCAAQYADVVVEYERAGGYAFEQQAQGALKAVGLGEQQLRLPLRRLSGGEVARVALVRALLQEPELLLLDEPDNHLDIDGIRWLERQLAAFRGTLMLVTHDRELMDNVIDTVVEIEDGALRVERGALGAYLERKRRRLERQRAEYFEQQRRVAKLKADIQRTEERARRFDTISTSDHWRRIGKKIAKTAVVRKRRFERELDEVHRVERPRKRPLIRLGLGLAKPRGDHLLRLSGVCKAYSGRVLLSEVDLELMRGQRLAVTGPNGCGKTTLLEIALGLRAADAGQVWRNAGASIFYGDQHQAGLDPKLSAYDVLARHTSLAPNQMYYQLAQMQLKNKAAHKPVSALSGGERTRLLLALLVNAQADLIVLDEPTNHLDLPSIEVLERALAGFAGSVLCISHDRRFIGQVATDALQLANGHLGRIDTSFGSGG